MNRATTRLAVTAASLALLLGAVACESSDDKPLKTQPTKDQLQTDTRPGRTDDAPSSASSPTPTRSTSKTPTQAAPAKVGDAISISGGSSGHTVDVTVVKVVDPAVGDNEYSTPAPNTRWIAIQWRVTNTSTESVDVTPAFGSAVIDSEGQQFDTKSRDITAGPSYPTSTSIAPGDSRLGYVVYEVPKNATIVKTQFKPGLFGGQTGQWNVP